MKKFRLLLFITVLLPGPHLAQTGNPVSPTPASERLSGFERRKEMIQESLVANVKFQSIGPSIMSGRVVAVEVNPDDPTHFYVAYASGGLWVTTNNGQSFKPLFDQEAVMTIGDIAVDWKHHQTIWVGTGENNSSRSSYSGTGIYKSDDQGLTWQHKGLAESHHTGKIVLHPQDSNMVWVAALGHLYSSDSLRGIYKTSDGGITWRQTLYVDKTTGGADLTVNPSNPLELYAACWQRDRRAWNFTESGPGSGIYKSKDGGESWKLITGGNSGFPQDSGTGRIGLALYPGNSNILYACLDNQNHRQEPDQEDASKQLTAKQLTGMPKDAFMLLENNLIDEYLNRNNFPEKYTAVSVKELMRKGKINPSTLADYTRDANTGLFNTPVTGQQLYRSDNGGLTWRKTHEGYLDDFVYTYGYYFGKVWVMGSDPDKIYMAGVPMLTSSDGGKTFKTIDADNTHGDHHALWINPKRPGHLILGDDGGLHISYDDGTNWFLANTPPVGQFYTVHADMDKPYNVYGGLQDNGVWTGPSTYKSGKRWHRSGRYPYKSLLGGDGMQVAVDTRDNNTVYTGYQFGYYYRINKSTGESESIRPRHDLGEEPYRFNWQTPIELSSHNQDILYLGANKLFRSMNKGGQFRAISGDLTKGGQAGDVAYGTLTSIDESPLKFGLIYAGSDDGQVSVTKNGGDSWTVISSALPQNLWVSRVAASAHEEGTVYVSLNGYRWDHFLPYLFVSDDYGQHWKKIGTDLPPEPINVIKEDPVNPSLLYVGTDHGVYVSLNRGETFMRMSRGLPSAPVHDLVVHSRDHDLVVGTHGRSLYKTGVAELQQLADSNLNKSIYVYNLPVVTISERWGSRDSQWEEPVEPQTMFSFYLREKGITTIRIKSHDGTILQELKDTSEKGLNFVSCNLSIDPARVDAFEKERQREMKGTGSGAKLKQADNKAYYLPAGWYNVSFTTTTGAAIQVKLEVQSREKRVRRESRKSVPGK